MRVLIVSLSPLWKEPPRLALSHNLGGMPNQNVAAVAIVGLQD